MATLLMNAHNIVASCCGPAGNIFAKIFQSEEEQVSDAATAPSAASGATAGKKFGFTDKQAKYEDVPWSKLPLSARKAAKTLGYEESTWDSKEWLGIDDYDWCDLSEEQRKACETLGWEETAWDSKYGEASWADFPEHVKKAAEKLGWSQQTWDEDYDVPAWNKGWEEFSEEEKRAMHVMGYYIHTWD